MDFFFKYGMKGLQIYGQNCIWCFNYVLGLQRPLLFSLQRVAINYPLVGIVCKFVIGNAFHNSEPWLEPQTCT